MPDSGPSRGDLIDTGQPRGGSHVVTAKQLDFVGPSDRVLLAVRRFMERRPDPGDRVRLGLKAEG